MDWMLTRVILASCAASFMLFGAFALFTASSVALYGAWRGLRSLRRGLPPKAAVVQGYVSLARTKTHDTTGAVVEPQIRLLSLWAGLLATLAALFSLGSSEGDAGSDTGPAKTPPDK